MYLASFVTFAGTMHDVESTMLPDGFYAGVGLGSISLDYKTRVTGIIPQSEHFGHSGALGDVFLGYNRDLSFWFNLGLEVFYSFYDLDNTLSGGNSNFSSIYQTNDNYGIKLMPAVNLRNNARIFADVGATTGQFEFEPSIIARKFGSPSSYSKSLLGVMLGVGTDVALTNNFSFRGEYQNISYNHWNISTPLTTRQMVKTQFLNNENQFIASFIYHFG